MCAWVSLTSWACSPMSSGRTQWLRLGIALQLDLREDQHRPGMGCLPDDSCDSAVGRGMEAASGLGARGAIRRAEFIGSLGSVVSWA